MARTLDSGTQSSYSLTGVQPAICFKIFSIYTYVCTYVRMYICMNEGGQASSERLTLVLKKSKVYVRQNTNIDLLNAAQSPNKDLSLQNSFPHNCKLRDWNGTLITKCEKILDQVETYTTSL